MSYIRKEKLSLSSSPTIHSFLPSNFVVRSFLLTLLGALIPLCSFAFKIPDFPTFQPELFFKNHDVIPKLYDVIVIGGGAAGCPVARTLAETGKDVMLIERGGSRNDYPDTQNMRATGWVVNDPHVSQLIITKEGVRSHTASILSGGTATNMGIVIAETNEYFDYVESLPGVAYDRSLLNDALNWTINPRKYPAPQAVPYGDAWRMGLEKVYGPARGNQSRLKINSTWEPYTFFDAQENLTRIASDFSLGMPGVDFPPTLDIVLNYTVQKIEFDFNQITQQHTAHCVRMQTTTMKDLAPIMSGAPFSIRTIAQRFTMFGAVPETGRFTTHTPTSSNYFTACLKPGGKIISSAGAILTPVLLYKSGIGPSEAVKNVGVKLIKETPELGNNLKDRVLIPINLFFKDSLPEEGFPPTIAQSTGITQIGTNCSNWFYNKKTLECSVVNAEELSGAKIAEGTLYATRLILPPHFRSDPVINVVFELLQNCASNSLKSISGIVSVPLCPIANPIIKCFRKIASNFCFTTEPKSFAKLTVRPGGFVEIAGNYLTDIQDEEDAMRGISNIVRLINTAPYENIFEQPSPHSCPLTIFNGLLKLIDNRFVKNKLLREGLKKNLQTIKTFFENQKAEYMEHVSWAEKEVSMRVQAENNNGNHHFEKEQLSNISISNYNVSNSQAYLSLQNISNATCLTKQLKNKQISESTWTRMFGEHNGLFQTYRTSQKYATFPPTIPEPSDPDALKAFAKTWMTSIWHWVGSASMGKVIDSGFKVYGFDNLYIVDASTMNIPTRMNPTITVMAMGRYAGLLINKDLTPTK